MILTDQHIRLMAKEFAKAHKCLEAEQDLSHAEFKELLKSAHAGIAQVLWPCLPKQNMELMRSLWKRECTKD